VVGLSYDGPMPEANRARVVIVGGGFSGLLTALHLLRQPGPPQVHLIERGAAFGRGAAYGTCDGTHLLNVRAANMSAFPDQPDHFLVWLAGEGDAPPDGFVSRARYGAYLQALLRQATASAPAGRLLLEADEAVAAARQGRGWRVTTRMGRRLSADALVLATGALQSAPPPSADPELLGSRRYVADPWAPGALEAAGRSVLLLGAGLTMVDVAFSLSGQGRRLVSVSRRGLLPQAHAPVAPPASIDRPEGSAAALSRQLRAEARTGDWRSAMDAWRPHLQAIWQGWPLAERRRFLRHLRPWWDIHRHRLAPAAAQRLQRIRGTGELEVHAGRVQAMRLRPQGVDVEWRPRGGGAAHRIKVDTVVNCAGFGALADGRDPLLLDLAEQGWVRPDGTGLGVEVGRHGLAGDRLYAVGPLCRGALWESTAIPDIRVQVAATALAIAAELAEPDSAGL
jgi:uncharacterized NAD(P)/FAD-binding protein YdhS